MKVLGLASAMAECPVQHDKIIQLLSFDYHQDNTQQYTIDDYIRKLRKTIVSLKLQNDFLEQKNNYLPKVLKNDNEILNFTRHEIESADYLQENINYVAITITYDINYFPQLLITPLWEQENYIKRILSKFLKEKNINSVYGSYELQQNGRIHFHGIIPYYGDLLELEKEMAIYFTNHTGKRQKAVLIKQIDDIQGWLNYINKKDSYKKFIEYQMDYVLHHMTKKTSNYFK